MLTNVMLYRLTGTAGSAPALRRRHPGLLPRPAMTPHRAATELPARRRATCAGESAGQNAGKSACSVPMGGVTFCLTEMNPWGLGARGSEAGQMPWGERVRRSRRRMWLAAAAGVAAAAVAAAAVAAWLSWPQPAVTPSARHYLDVTACLLTTSSGIAPGTPGAPAWKAMQTASLDTHVMVSYLPEPGPADAAAMLATLTERQCGVIIVAGPAPARFSRRRRRTRTSGSCSWPQTAQPPRQCHRTPSSSRPPARPSASIRRCTPSPHTPRDCLAGPG